MFFKRYGKLLLALLFIFLVVEVVLIAPTMIREGDEKEPVMSDEAPANAEVDQIMRGVHLVEASEGSREWELWAEEAKSLKVKEMWSLNEVKATFFSKDGTEFKVTGDRGEVHTDSKDMMVAGNVLVRSTNGYQFRTQTVRYSSKDKTLFSPDSIEMLGPRDQGGRSMSLKGRELRARMTDSLMEVLKDVQAEKTFPDKKRVSIRSNKALFSGKSKLARFTDDVVIDFENMRITGPSAEFQYDSQNKIIESMYVDGGVRVSDQDKWATSQNVKVDFNKEQYTFKGSPRVVQNNDELRGKEIIFLEGGKRVQVIGARARVDEGRLEN